MGINKAANTAGNIGLVLLTLHPWTVARASGFLPFDEVADVFRATRMVLSGKAVFVFRPPDSMVDGLTEDFAHLIAQRSIASGQGLEPGSWELGLSAESVRFAHKDIWQATAGVSYEKVEIPKLHLRVGLSSNMSGGLSLYRNPSSGVRIEGLDLAHRLLPENGKLPALSLSAGMSRISGVDRLRFSTLTAGASVSKRMPWGVPYAGVAYTQARGHYSSVGVPSFDMRAGFARAFLGVETRMGPMIVTGEMGFKQGGGDLGLRAAWRFD